MKKIIATVAALALIGAGAFWFLNRPAEVRVTALLTPDGPDVTDRVNWDVYQIVSETVGTGGSLIETLAMTASPDDSNLFTVPPGQEIVIEASLRGLNDVEQITTVSAGATEDITLVLDAGIVTIDVITGDGDTRDWRVQVPTGSGSITGYPFDGTTTELAFATGSHQVDLYGDDFAASQVIDVTAGEISTLTFDMRSRDLSVQLGDAGWSDDLPEIFITLENADTGDFLGEARVGNEAAAFTAVPYGNYVVKAVRPGGSAMTWYDVQAEAEVNESSDSVVIPFDFIRLDVDLSAFEDTTGLNVFAIETTQKGERFSSARADGSDSVSVYLAPAADYYASFDYGYAVRNRSGFLSVVGIDRPDMNSTVQVTAVPGEGRALCIRLYGESSCEAIEAD